MPLEVQGHRGMRGLYPENTLPGFRAAIEANVPVLECDILASQDGVLVVTHDFALNRKKCTLLGKPPETEPLLSSLTLEEIKQYDCGGADPAFPKQIPILGTPIPTLGELFDLVTKESKAASTRLNLEIKRDAAHPEMTFGPDWFAEAILREVHLSGLEKRVYYSSFDFRVLSHIRKLDPKSTIGLLFCERGVSRFFRSAIPQSILEQAEELQAKIFSPKHSYLKTKNQVELLQKKGFRIIPWTVNDPMRWGQLIEMGVDGIITDYPKTLLEYLASQRDM